MIDYGRLSVVWTDGLVALRIDPISGVVHRDM